MTNKALGPSEKHSLGVQLLTSGGRDRSAINKRGSLRSSGVAPA